MSSNKEGRTSWNLYFNVIHYKERFFYPLALADTMHAFLPITHNISISLFLLTVLCSHLLWYYNENPDSSLFVLKSSFCLMKQSVFNKGRLQSRFSFKTIPTLKGGIVSGSSPCHLSFSKASVGHLALFYSIPF